MVGHGAKFLQKMDQAIAALLSCKNVEGAARAVGIGTNTLLRWIREPEFEAAFREARRFVHSQALGRLQEASGAAATTILKIMLDPNAPAGHRLRAAEDVLEHAARTSDLEDLKDRVAKLERKAGLKKSSRQPLASVTLLKATPLLGPSPTQAQTAPQLDGTATDEDEGK